MRIIGKTTPQVTYIAIIKIPKIRLKIKNRGLIISGISESHLSISSLNLVKILPIVMTSKNFVIEAENNFLVNLMCTFLTAFRFEK
jgi:hypothetical protein